ncbi:MAG: rhamnan synthesis F family protein [Chlorobium sp.]
MQVVQKTEGWNKFVGLSFLNAQIIMEYIFSQAALLNPRHIVLPLGWIGHIPFAFWLTDNARPDVVVELGTHSGNSYFAFCQSVQEYRLPTKCFAVDTWQGDEHAGYYGEEIYAEVLAHNQQYYSKFSTLMKMKFDDARPYFSDGTIDLLHIDGLHTYQAVKHDFDCWLPKMSEKGIVLFHDTNVREQEFGVWKLFDELSLVYPCISFDHSNGLGVVFTGKQQNETFKQLIQDWHLEEKRAFVKNFFVTVADRLALGLNVKNLTSQLKEMDSRLIELELTIQKNAVYKDQLERTILDIFQPSKDTEPLPGQKKNKFIRKLSNSVRKRLRKLRAFVHKKQFLFLDSKFDPLKRTILVVSHDASRTGAPILSLNLVQLLAEHYNVIVLLLGKGELIETFKLAAAAVIFEPSIDNNKDADHVISGICRRYILQFAIVNSIESRVALPVLASLFVPSISLLHEFASYTKPRHAFRDAYFWSTETVFSTNLTLENALAEYPGLNRTSVKVFPQGRCVVPSKDITARKLDIERSRLIQQMRPSGKSDDAFVVMGAGTVQLRKGVDLFIECASRVVHAPGGDKCRFVWVGKGYDIENDLGYSVYLADQIERSGIEKHFVFTGETSEIELAYQLADVFLLSSRLDPFPNVAIDAMSNGLPVICFEKTTGIADFLIQNGVGDYCVAPYLDTVELSKKLMAFVRSAALMKQVGDQCRTASLLSFRMQDYVLRLETLAVSARNKIDQERIDGEEIIKSCMFRKMFALPPNAQNTSEVPAISGYIRSWKTGIGPRKPFPGFHPGIYLESYGLANENADPFADYLRNGCPQGPWCYNVISSVQDSRRSKIGNAKVALHLHVYYPYMLPEIIKRLELNEIRPDLFVSVKDQFSRKLVLDILADYKGNVVDVRIVPNRGRDIGPLLTAFGRELIEGYDLVGHLHTKQSLDVTNRAVILDWNNFLLENLIGGRSGGRMADTIISAMTNDPSIGIVFPDDPNAIGWTANREIAEKMALRLGLFELSEAFNFPVGTMFWIRKSRLARFVELDLHWDDYPPEPLPYDGSMLHALERLFGSQLTAENINYAVTYVSGVTR